MSDPILSLKEVSLTLKGNAGAIKILRDVNLEVTAGSTLGLIGPSGSGKSSLLMIMGGLEQASSGQVLALGHSLGDMNEDELAIFRRDNMGVIFLNKSQINSAVKSFEWAIAYKYDYAEAHNNLGNTLSDFGQTDSAIDSFKKAISLNPNYARAVFNLALVYRDIGNQKACQEMIEKTIRLKPHWSYAHLELSRVKKYQKNFKQKFSPLKVLVNPRNSVYCK